MELLVNIDVDDLARAEAFYTTAFGLTVGQRFGTDGLALRGASSALYLLAKPAGSRAAPGTAATRDCARHWTPVHLDLVVPDVDAAVTHAVAAGATLEQATTDRAWGRIALLADTFGHGVCLLQFRGRGYDEIATSSGP